MKVYIASGWFNPQQQADLDLMKECLNDTGLDYYSPKDQNECKNFADPAEQEKVFATNLHEIHDCDFIVVNTRDKDLGTIFEAGYAYCIGVPILYYCAGLKGMFNLMLSRSGSAVATNREELMKHLAGLRDNVAYECEYKGSIE